jgi:hypothetical protein
MSASGELPRADYAIFADTGWEPQAVYDHLDRLKALNEIPILTVSAGNLRADALSDSRFASMPLFTKNETTGKVSMLRRQCTREYKVAPIQKKCRELGASAKNPAEVWVGISIDEAHRMKDSFVKYTTHRWPLIDARIDRNACRIYLEARGWDVPKSSCIGCPFHDDHYWRRLKMDSPEEFADAVAFDRSIRKLDRLQDETFLHRSARPLENVDFSEDQGDLWGNECEGYCGL